MGKPPHKGSKILYKITVSSESKSEGEWFGRLQRRTLWVCRIKTKKKWCNSECICVWKEETEQNKTNGTNTGFSGRKPGALKCLIWKLSGSLSLIIEYKCAHFWVQKSYTGFTAGAHTQLLPLCDVNEFQLFHIRECMYTVKNYKYIINIYIYIQ